MNYSKAFYQSKGIPTQTFVIGRGKHGYGFTLSGQVCRWCLFCVGFTSKTKAFLYCYKYLQY